MSVDKNKYGEKFNEHLLEQYKLYVEMADRISERRMQTNKFYISLLSGLLALLSILVSVGKFNQTVIFIIVSLLGIALCILWHINIRSYKQLNSGKFKVIHEMEQYLPFPCYDKEWELLGEGKEKSKYLQLTRVEKYIPFILAIPYIFLFFYALVSLLIPLIWKK
ncbi:MAG: hypothetical protein H0Z16_03220 [Thermodesulfobacterium sp.]|nr:hypothetical protein [Thermodesulfobacterium sp.]